MRAAEAERKRPGREKGHRSGELQRPGRQAGHGVSAFSRDRGSDPGGAGWATVRAVTGLELA